jgi:hypothetical protein
VTISCHFCPDDATAYKGTVRRSSIPFLTRSPGKFTMSTFLVISG